MDTKTQTVANSKNEIDVHIPVKLNYWVDKFGVTNVKIKAAVNAVGSSLKAVELIFGKDSMTRLLTLCLACLVLVSCAAPKSIIVTDTAVIRTYAQPLKIFGIGYWGKKYLVLTLTDAHGQYLTVLVRRNDALKVGMSMCLNRKNQNQVLL